MQNQQVTSKIKMLRSGLIDFIGLNRVFMLQNNCPPTSKIEVGKKGGLNYCVRYTCKASGWRTLRVESGLKLF